MSIIAWDGKTLAVDRNANWNGIRRTIRKSRRIASGEVIAWAGTLVNGQRLADWYEHGADPDKFPDCQKEEDFAHLVVASNDGVKEYGFGGPTPLIHEDVYQAWGSGSQLALGALAMGATAKEAVEVACQFCDSCGMGIDVYELDLGGNEGTMDGQWETRNA